MMNDRTSEHVAVREHTQSRAGAYPRGVACCATRTFVRPTKVSGSSEHYLATPKAHCRLLNDLNKRGGGIKKDEQPVPMKIWGSILLQGRSTGGSGIVPLYALLKQMSRSEVFWSAHTCKPITWLITLVPTTSYLIANARQCLGLRPSHKRSPTRLTRDDTTKFRGIKDGS